MKQCKQGKKKFNIYINAYAQRSQRSAKSPVRRRQPFLGLSTGSLQLELKHLNPDEVEAAAAAIAFKSSKPGSAHTEKKTKNQKKPY